MKCGDEIGFDLSLKTKSAKKKVMEASWVLYAAREDEMFPSASGGK